MIKYAIFLCELNKLDGMPTTSLVGPLFSTLEGIRYKVEEDGWTVEDKEDYTGWYLMDGDDTEVYRVVEIKLA